MPVAVRKWWFNRKMKHEKDKQKKPNEGNSAPIPESLKGSKKDGRSRTA